MADKAKEIKAPVEDASQKTAAEVAAEAKKKVGRPRAPQIDPNLRIHLVASTNPKRPGTKSHVRFACYRDGMTVAQFGEAVEKAGQPKSLAIADIRYDVAHKSIELRP